MIKGDKIRLIKPMGAFTNVGEVCEVTDIREDKTIWFRFGGVHLGCMSYDEFKKYFEIVEYEHPRRSWTKWLSVPYEISLAYAENDEDFGNLLYRHNGKQVQVKILAESKVLRASATCYKTDKFDLHKGLRLASKRLFAKVLAYMAECNAKNM